MKLIPEVKAAWCAALRSGVYPQAQGYLHRTASKEEATGYCCLGVLARTLGVPEEPMDKYCTRFDFNGDTATGMPPREWVDTLFTRDREVIEINEEKVLVYPENVMSHLAEDMNDGGKTFNEIADWIEENL